jgi:hypothetical protein
MSETPAPYLVERQSTSGSDWLPVTRCCSLEYARLVAATGFRRHIGVAYRAIHGEPGVEIELLPDESDQPSAVSHQPCQSVC